MRITVHYTVRNIVQERFLSSLSQMPSTSWSKICFQRNTWRDKWKSFRSSIIIQEDRQSRLLLADANAFVQHYGRCQHFANLLHSPSEELTPMTTPWPFTQWGLDIRGGQKTAKPDPPDQSGRIDRPSVSIYTDGYGYKYFKYLDNGRITDFKFLVKWIPDPPDNINLNDKKKT